MQLDFSSTRKGTPLSRKHAATAKPDGPDPTMMGPLKKIRPRGYERLVILANVDMIKILELGCVFGKKKE